MACFGHIAPPNLVAAKSGEQYPDCVNLPLVAE